MCTVTFVPIPETHTGFIVTSNRDEAYTRATVPPKIYKKRKANLVFPKDTLAGGTWIGASSKMRFIVLMNGAFAKYDIHKQYAKSRGLVVKELLASEDILHAIERYAFEEVAPFTMIVATWKAGLEIYKLVWDQTKVHFIKLENKPQIWSSAMTYDKTMEATRKDWFASFVEKQPEKAISPEALWKFHHETGIEDKNTGLIIDRGLLKTTSITQFIHQGTENKLHYHDLIVNKKSVLTMDTSFNLKQ